MSDIIKTEDVVDTEVVETTTGVLKYSYILNNTGYKQIEPNTIVSVIEGNEQGNLRVITEGFELCSDNKLDMYNIITEDGYTLVVSGDTLVPTRDRGDVKAYELLETDFLLIHNATYLEPESYDKEFLDRVIGTVIDNGLLNQDEVAYLEIECVEGIDRSKLQLELLEIGIKTSCYKNLIVNGVHLTRLMDLLGKLGHKDLLDTFNEVLKTCKLDSRFNEFSSKIGVIEYMYGVKESIRPINNDDLIYVSNGILVKK